MNEPSQLPTSNKEASYGPLRIIISGAPASGKGTQCEKIKEFFGVVHLSTGDMLRAAVSAGTETGNIAQQFMEEGKLVPDHVMIRVVKERLNKRDCQRNGWLLDGFPRTPAQADALSEADIHADIFIFLHVPDEIVIERVVGRRTDPKTGKIYNILASPPNDKEILDRLVQRSDDTKEKVAIRLEEFHSNVEAFKRRYTDIVVDIQGIKPPDEVTNDIKAAIRSKIALWKKEE